MPSIGGILQDERENQGRTLKEVSAKTNIKEVYLAAIEDDAYEDIPGEAFVKGFIRNYANFLGLDGAAMVNQYKQYKLQVQTQTAGKGDTSPHLEKKQIEPKVKKKQGALPKITIIAGAILFLLLCLWLFI